MAALSPANSPLPRLLLKDGWRHLIEIERYPYFKGSESPCDVGYKLFQGDGIWERIETAAENRYHIPMTGNPALASFKGQGRLHA